MEISLSGKALAALDRHYTVLVSVRDKVQGQLCSYVFFHGKVEGKSTLAPALPSGIKFGL
jgi:hypothetical protein